MENFCRGINTSLASSLAAVYIHTEVPELLKKSVIIPAHKKPCPKYDNDYRPAALTSNVMKELEKIIAEKLRIKVEVCYLTGHQHHR